jgi:tetratricopeptide (TPR) repeat protein
VDQQTKAKLKQDNFVTTTSHGLEWASENRKSVTTTVGILLGVIVLAVLIGVIANHRSESAAAAFGSAISTYEAPLVTSGQPPEPGVKSFNSVAERAHAAQGDFQAVADHYGWTSAGRNARYFVGLTLLDQGQNASAESTLKQVADGWDKEMASLAKIALADLYHQTGRDSQAVDIYNQLTDKPTDAVPSGLAQIQLAELYTAQGKTDQAHKIYAQLKDKDKDAKGTPGPAASIATQKLNPAAAEGPQL